MNHLVRSQGDFSLLECAMKRKLSRATEPRGIWLWIHGGRGWIETCSCVNPQWMSPQHCPNTVLHLGQIQTEWHCILFMDIFEYQMSPSIAGCAAQWFLTFLPDVLPKSCQMKPSLSVHSAVYFPCYPKHFIFYLYIQYFIKGVSA